MRMRVGRVWRLVMGNWAKLQSDGVGQVPDAVVGTG